MSYEYIEVLEAESMSTAFILFAKRRFWSLFLKHNLKLIVNKHEIIQIFVNGECANSERSSEVKFSKTGDARKLGKSLLGYHILQTISHSIIGCETHLTNNS